MKSSFTGRSCAPLVASLFAVLMAAPAVGVQIPTSPIVGGGQVQLVADQWRGTRVVRSLSAQEGWCSWHQLVRARGMAPGSSISAAQLQACMELTRWPSEDCRAEKGKRIRLRTISGVTYCIPVARQRRAY
jgi:hypothetical protein